MTDQIVHVSRDFTFEAAHRLPSHTGACRKLHGHTYNFTVELKGEVIDAAASDSGMVIDFATFNAIVQERIISRIDHTTLIYKDDPLADLLAPVPGVIIVDYVPTAENIAKSIYTLLDSITLRNAKLVRVTVYETPKTSATIYAPVVYPSITMTTSAVQRHDH